MNWSKPNDWDWAIKGNKMDSSRLILRIGWFEIIMTSIFKVKKSKSGLYLDIQDPAFQRIGSNANRPIFLLIVYPDLTVKYRI